MIAVVVIVIGEWRCRRERDHMTEYREVAHLKLTLSASCLVSRPRGCVLIIQGRRRMGVAVCTICGLWY